MLLGLSTRMSECTAAMYITCHHDPIKRRLGVRDSCYVSARHGEMPEALKVARTQTHWSPNQTLRRFGTLGFEGCLFSDIGISFPFSEGQMKRTMVGDRPDRESPKTT